MKIGLTREKINLMPEAAGVDEKTRRFIIKVIEENNRELIEGLMRIIDQRIERP